MRLFITILAFLCLGNSVCFAQRSRSRQHNKKEKVTVEQLISSYRFSEAAEQLEDKISLLERRRKPTEELDSLLDRVRSLEVMLSATEKVRFIDSIVVNKKNFLSVFHLGSDCGKIASPKAILPETLAGMKGLGDVAYCNELQDMIYFPKLDEEGNPKLYFTARIGDAWSKEKPLKGISEEGIAQDYPFVLSDGVTMYYSQINDEGLGGYDIYVTRYNSDTDSYLKPENIGMPFNSMANDYMYAIDEVNNLGWFVTDRNQPKDTVCIYIFQPNVAREVYNPIAMGEDVMRRLAMIHSINDARLNKVSLEKARVRLQSVKSEPVSKNFGEQVRYVINDHTVYTSLLDFKNEEAQRLAMEWAKENSKLKELVKNLDSLREEYDNESATAEEKAHLLEIEAMISNLRERVNILAKNMRKAELR